MSGATPTSPAALLSTLPGTRKMPEPITVPTTMRSRSRSPSTRARSRCISVPPPCRPCADRIPRVAARQPDDRLRAAEGDAALVGDLVTQRRERPPHVVADRRLERDAAVVQMAEARRVDPVLQVHPEHEEVQEHLPRSEEHTSELQ